MGVLYGISCGINASIGMSFTGVKNGCAFSSKFATIGSNAGAAVPLLGVQVHSIKDSHLSNCDIHSTPRKSARSADGALATSSDALGHTTHSSSSTTGKDVIELISFGLGISNLSFLQYGFRTRLDEPELSIFNLKHE